METKKLKVSDEIIYIAESEFGFTNGKKYNIFGIDEEDFMFYYVIDDNGRKTVFDLLNFEKYFKLKEETAKLKPHSFCETPEEKCTLGYCDENGCMNRKRVLVEPELNVAYKETNGKLFYELDFEFITQIAERMASNKGKYDPFNWQKPMEEKDFKELLQAVFRHSLEIVEGKFEDDGREFGHLEAIACDVMMICYQLKKHKKI